MHPIIPFYSLAALVAVFGVGLRDRMDRSAVWLGGWSAMVASAFAVIFRDIWGDSTNYYNDFVRMSAQSFSQMWADTHNNWLFAATSWLLSRLGTHPLIFFAPLTVLCVVLLAISLREILTAKEVGIVLLIYSAYPFFIAYLANTMKQGVAMAILMQAYALLYSGRTRMALVWFILAPGFHTGALLVYPFVVLHYFIWRPGFGYRRAFALSGSLFIAATLLSISGVNRQLMSFAQVITELDYRYEGYFRAAAETSYRVGFRVDFMLFSLIPIVAALMLHSKSRRLTLARSGWWINLYLLLACIYQLFSFAPFADRFAAFSWYIIPLLVVIMLGDYRKKILWQAAIVAFSVINIFILQFRLGNAIAMSV